MVLNFFRKKEVKKKSEAAPRLRNHYAAAKLDRLTADWGGVTFSPDSIIKGSLARLRARSRQLAMDNDYARRFFKLCRANVVGSEGVRLQVRAIEKETSAGVVYDDNANKIIEKNWLEWALKKNCSIDGRLSWIDICQLCIESVAKDGEIFIRKIKGKTAGNPFAFALQIIEADHVDDQYNLNLNNNNKIRMGIELNEWNRPVAYYISKHHPADNTKTTFTEKYERIPANEIIHLFITERASQSRGVPWMHSAMRRFNMLGGYEEAELVAARLGASKMGFYTSEDGEGYTGEKDEEGRLISEAEPGLFEQLPAGVDFKSFDPQHPTTSFASFIKAMLRGAASGIGVSYNTLANDLEGVNFSSIRQGVLEEREHWKLLQTWLIEHLCADVFESWLLMSLTTQKIPLPLSKFEKFNNPIWRARGWNWVDPLKEVKSNIEAVTAGFKSAQDIASEQGMDIEDVYAQLAVEEKLRKKYDIKLGNPDMQGMNNAIIAGGSGNG